MKRIKYFLSLLVALSIGLGVKAQTFVFEGNAEARQLTNVTLKLAMKNTVDVRGFQFDITLPAALTPTIAKASNSVHDFEVVAVGEGRYRVLSYAMDNATYAANFGTVASVTFTVPESLAPDEYDIVVSDAYLSDKQNQKIVDTGCKARLTVLPKYVSPQSVTLSAQSLNLLLGLSAELTATVAPENTTDKAVTWTSSDATVATVDDNGKVVAVGLGEATITATAVGGVKAECKVKVDPVLSTEIKLSKSELSLLIGSKETLTATVLPENTTDKSVTWTSSDEGVAVVSANGTVVAVGLGKATITAKNGTSTATCEVTVKPILAESVTLSASSLSLLLGGSAELAASVSPDNVTDKTIVWASSNEDVAIVSTSGKIVAVGLGETTVTATAVGGAKAECKVTVNPIPSEGVTINKTTLVLLLGDTETLIATVLPATATDKSVTWTSSDETVATVTTDGTIAAVGVGTAKITAKNGTSTATCEVTVKPILAESVTLDKTEVSITIGETSTLTATVAPENTTDKTVTWTSSDETVATVDAEGKVTAVGVGEATITATAVGGVKAECKVTVNPILAESVTLDKTEVSIIIGETAKLTATVAPENTTDKTVTWTSSDEKVATVDAEGKITAIGAGVATITATCGPANATCKVTVEKKSQEITWTQAFENVCVGDVIELSASASSDLTVSFTITSGEDNAVLEGTTLTVLKAGVIELMATQDGNEQFAAAKPVVKTIENIFDAIHSVAASENATIVVTNVQGICIYRGRRAEMPKLPNGIYVITDLSTKQTKKIVVRNRR